MKRMYLESVWTNCCLGSVDSRQLFLFISIWDKFRTIKNLEIIKNINNY